jgi:hypothetical protein
MISLITYGVEQDRSQAYEQALKEKSRIIHETEAKNLNRKQRSEFLSLSDIQNYMSSVHFVAPLLPAGKAREQHPFSSFPSVKERSSAGA